MDVVQNESEEAKERGQEAGVEEPPGLQESRRQSEVPEEKKTMERETDEPTNGAGEDDGEVEAGQREAAGKRAAGLRRSIETVIVFPCLRMSKVFWPLDNTSKGPSYGGTRGFLTAST